MLIYFREKEREGERERERKWEREVNESDKTKTNILFIFNRSQLASTLCHCPKKGGCEENIYFLKNYVCLFFKNYVCLFLKLIYFKRSDENWSNNVAFPFVKWKLYFGIQVP